MVPYITEKHALVALTSRSQATGLTNEKVKSLNAQMNDRDDCAGP